MRTGYAVLIGVLGVMAWCGGQVNGQTTPTVDVSYSTNTPSVVTVGSTFEVSVLAQIMNPGTDGIFVFSQDFAASNVLPDATPPFQVVSVSRPGTDDASFTGSDGTDSTTPSGDVLASGIYGGYDDATVGIGSPVTLYTVTLKAVAPGSATISDGPSTAGGYFTNINTADGFLLYDGSTPPAVYPIGPTLVAIGLPEPVSISAVAMAWLVLSRRRGRTKQVS